MTRLSPGAEPAPAAPERRHDVAALIVPDPAAPLPRDAARLLAAYVADVAAGKTSEAAILSVYLEDAMAHRAAGEDGSALRSLDLAMHVAKALSPVHPTPRSDQ